MWKQIYLNISKERDISHNLRHAANAANSYASFPIKFTSIILVLTEKFNYFSHSHLVSTDFTRKKNEIIENVWDVFLKRDLNFLFPLNHSKRFFLGSNYSKTQTQSLYRKIFM